MGAKHRIIDFAFDCCPHCGVKMHTPSGKKHESRTIATRDHILPRAWAVFGIDGVKNIRIVCKSCNELRAHACHCPAALACAMAVRVKGESVRERLQRWGFPNG